ncbi:esterase family protein [Oribacterium sp. WCC10]|uniref:esterase family protein n=1 Tax=Oribacterium sp. WCC10 TaxID=1855343 RepID=UPI0008E84CCC|nr:alpha/beta hydrolase-fold protein [Oribacterium sp. WCC10]SFG06771.1 Esterase/lipase superfamily enzyme [Oribacterium sp. WCC10]
MEREQVVLHSKQLNRDMNLIIYGTKGVPVVGFPTKSTKADDWENNGMVKCLEDYIDKGIIQLYTVDTVDNESWLNESGEYSWRTSRQESYYQFIIEELLPLIRKKNKTKELPIAAGVGMGANHAAIVFLRRPDLFQAVISLSGIHDVRYFFDNYIDHDLYENAPERFLENMPPDHPYIDLYNKRKLCFCAGQGSQEFDSLSTLKTLERRFITKSIDAWCDYWGRDVTHDWYWWCKQMEYFLPYVLGLNDEDEA